jgi:hypothetical protein
MILSDKVKRAIVGRLVVMQISTECMHASRGNRCVYEVELHLQVNTTHLNDVGAALGACRHVGQLGLAAEQVAVVAEHGATGALGHDDLHLVGAITLDADAFLDVQLLVQHVSAGWWLERWMGQGR